jgi:hypothetical protein
MPFWKFIFKAESAVPADEITGLECCSVGGIALG